MRNKLKYILITGLLLCTGFCFLRVSQDLHAFSEDNRRLMQEVAALELKLSETEMQFQDRQATLVYVLSGRGEFLPVLSPSGFTAEMYEQAWENLGACGLTGIGESIALAEKVTGVNGLVLAAIAYLESGGGRSAIAAGKNNLFGLGAHGSNPYTHALSFESKEDSVIHAATLLSRSYLSREGRFYHGDDLRAVGKVYASDPRWAEKVSRTMVLIVLSLEEAS